MVSCGLLAQTVTTTNEVRAMRGLGPIEGTSPVSESRPGAPTVQWPEVEELEG
jgi:hypothetical protein